MCCNGSRWKYLPRIIYRDRHKYILFVYVQNVGPCFCSKFVNFMYVQVFKGFLIKVSSLMFIGRHVIFYYE